MLFKDTQGILRKYKRSAFKPGQEDLDPSLEYYNLWKPSLIKPVKGDTSAWNAHIEWLIPNPVERAYALDWMAWVYQNQNQKPGMLLLIVGPTTGTGKSYVCRVFEQLIGVPNTQRPKNSSLNGDFNAWAAHCKLAIFEELMHVGRKELQNNLKAIITEDRFEVNIKGISAYTIENVIAVMGTSNHPDALPLDTLDRRWAIIASPVTVADREAMRADGHFARIMPMVKRPELPASVAALSAIAYELQRRDVRKFTPGDAPMTEGKAQMIELGRDELERWMNENRHNPPFTREVVNIDDDIIPMVPETILRKSRNPSADIAKFLKSELDGVKIGSHQLGKGRNAKQSQLWALNDKGVEAKNRIAKGAAPRNALGTINVTELYRLEREDRAVEALSKQLAKAAADFAEPYDDKPDWE